MTNKEPKRSEWIKRGPFYICNRCGLGVNKNVAGFFIKRDAFNYCPNCGADMRGADNETDN